VPCFSASFAAHGLERFYTAWRREIVAVNAGEAMLNGVTVSTAAAKQHAFAGIQQTSGR
jgi:hypothetical protein